MPVSYSIPQVGEPNTSAAPKIDNALAAIQTYVNGHIDSSAIGPGVVGTRELAAVPRVKVPFTASIPTGGSSVTYAPFSAATYQGGGVTVVPSSLGFNVNPSSMRPGLWLVAVSAVWGAGGGTFRRMHLNPGGSVVIDIADQRSPTANNEVSIMHQVKDPGFVQLWFTQDSGGTLSVSGDVSLTFITP